MLEGKPNLTNYYVKARHLTLPSRIGYEEENMGDHTIGISARHPFHCQRVSGE
jgi:hypothetical protein